MSKVIEAEGGEIGIWSSTGVFAIVPKNKVRWVKSKIEQGCDECVDNFVKNLPKIG